MGWSIWRRKIEKAVGIFVLAATAGSYPASAQPLLTLPERERQQELIETIQQEQTENGPYSEDLLVPLETLALLYLEGGDHTLAVGAIERILQVIRANYGLTSIEQLPWIRQWAASEEARGDVEAAWNLEQSLLDLTAEHPTHLDIVPILHEIGDKRMTLLEEYEGGAFPPQITLGCFYNPSRNPRRGSCQAGSRRVVVNGIVTEAWRHYRNAIDVLRHHRLYSSDELVELEMKLLESSYRYGNYRLGRRSLRRLASYAMENEAPTSTQLRALAEIADWELVFADTSRRRRDAALEGYRRLFRHAGQDVSARETLDEIFWPEVPVVLPTFLPNPLITRETPDSVGYIDVAFDVTPRGARNVDILSTSGPVTKSDERRLSRLISNAVFRPRTTDGRFEDPSHVTLRYHVRDEQTE